MPVAVRTDLALTHSVTHSFGFRLRLRCLAAGVEERLAGAIPVAAIERRRVTRTRIFDDERRHDVLRVRPMSLNTGSVEVGLSRLRRVVTVRVEVADLDRVLVELVALLRRHHRNCDDSANQSNGQGDAGSPSTTPEWGRSGHTPEPSTDMNGRHPPAERQPDLAVTLERVPSHPHVGAA